MVIPFCVVSGCFHTTIAELSSCHCMACKILTLWPFIEKTCWLLLWGMVGRSLGPWMTAWSMGSLFQ